MSQDETTYRARPPAGCASFWSSRHQKACEKWQRCNSERATKEHPGEWVQVHGALANHRAACRPCAMPPAARRGQRGSVIAMISAIGRTSSVSRVGPDAPVEKDGSKPIGVTAKERHTRWAVPDDAEAAAEQTSFSRRSLSRRLSAMIFGDSIESPQSGELYSTDPQDGAGIGGGSSRDAPPPPPPSGGSKRKSVFGRPSERLRLSYRSRAVARTQTQLSWRQVAARDMARHKEARKPTRSTYSKEEVRFYRRVFEMIDTDAGGSIDEEEFVQGLAKEMSAAEDSTAHARSDGDRMRFIDALYKGLQIGYTPAVELGENGNVRSRARAIFKHLDVDGGGSIDFGEMVSEAWGGHLCVCVRALG